MRLQSAVKMAKIGLSSEFSVNEDGWEIYVERVKLFFIANNVKNDAKVAVFLTVIENEAYKKIRALCTPAAPDSKTFDDLVTVMKNNGSKIKPKEIAAILLLITENNNQVKQSAIITLPSKS